MQAEDIILKQGSKQRSKSKEGSFYSRRPLLLRLVQLAVGLLGRQF